MPGNTAARPAHIDRTLTSMSDQVCFIDCSLTGYTEQMFDIKSYEEDFSGRLPVHPLRMFCSPDIACDFPVLII